MTTPRLFSVLRRKPSLIDMIIPLRPASEAVAQYRLKTDTVPSGSFSTTCFTTTYGFVDPAVAGHHHVIQPGNHVRAIFNPTNYNLTNNACWVKVVYVDGAGSEMSSPAPGAATLLLPTFQGPYTSGFTATAPNQASLANSLALALPLVEGVRIKNLETSAAMFVAFDSGGPEVEVPAGVEIGSTFGPVSTIFVRGNSATAKFHMTFTTAYPR